MMYLKIYTSSIYTPKTSFYLLIYLFSSGCDGEIDHNDELGFQDGVERPRTEIIRLDRSSPLSEIGKIGKIDSIRNDLRRENVRGNLDGKENIDRLNKKSRQDAYESDNDYGSAIIYDPAGRFTVQVAGYQNAAKAKDLSRELRDDGYPAYVTKRGGSGEVRVRIGYFSSFEDASNFGRLLYTDRNLEFWVDRRENE